MSPRPTVLAVANSRNAGCGRMTRRWSSRVRRPEISSTRWITNITSGRPASYSSKQRAMLFWSAQGSMPSRNSVTCLPSLSTIASLPTRSMRETWLSRLMRTQRPVQPRGDLLDMGRLAGAVIAGDHHAAVEGEAGQNRERGVPVEEVVRVEIGHMFVALRIGGHLHVGIDAENLSHRDPGIRRPGRRLGSD